MKKTEKEICDILFTGIRNLGASVALSKSLVKMVRKYNSETINDYICGAWTEETKKYALAVSKMAGGYRATFFKVNALGDKFRHAEYFIAQSQGALFGELVAEMQYPTTGHFILDDNDNRPGEWIALDTPRERARITMNNTLDSLDIEKFGVFYRDEVTYLY